MTHITLLMEDKNNETPQFLTEDNVVENHYPVDFEVSEGIKCPEYEAEVRDLCQCHKAGWFLHTVHCR